MSLTFYIVYKGTKKEAILFDRNITHNISEMWNEAGIWEALYESDGEKPSEIIDVLKKGLKDMNDRPEFYKQFNPSNGWGDYDGAISFLTDVIEACENFPDAVINVSR